MPVKPAFFLRIYRAADVDVVTAFSVDTKLVLELELEPPWALGLHTNHHVSSWLHLTLVSLRRLAVHGAVFPVTVLFHPFIFSATLEEPFAFK